MCNKEDEASSEAKDSGEETDYAEIEWYELDDQDFANTSLKVTKDFPGIYSLAMKKILR